MSDIHTLVRVVPMYELVAVCITWVTDTGVCAPVVAALAVLRADVGVAGVGQVTAVLHADLQTLSHVHVGHVVGRLTHTHTLAEKKKEEGSGENCREVFLFFEIWKSSLTCMQPTNPLLTWLSAPGKPPT